MKRLPHLIGVDSILHHTGILQDRTLMLFVWVKDGSDELGDSWLYTILLDQSVLLEPLIGIPPHPLEEGYSKHFSAFVVAH